MDLEPHMRGRGPLGPRQVQIKGLTWAGLYSRFFQPTSELPAKASAERWPHRMRLVGLYSAKSGHSCQPYGRDKLYYS